MWGRTQWGQIHHEAKPAATLQTIKQCLVINQNVAFSQLNITTSITKKKTVTIKEAPEIAI